MNLPNALALARAVAVVPLMALLARPGQEGLAFALFAIAAATDVADGALARAWGQETRVGAFLDPLADKILVLGTLAALVASSVVPWWVFVLVLGREVFVTALRAAGAPIGTTRLAKAKTALQYLALAALLVPFLSLGYVLLAAALVLTVLSGAEYVARAAWAPARAT